MSDERGQFEKEHGEWNAEPRSYEAGFAAGRLSGLEEAAAWIPVEERLPPEGHIVLVYSDKIIDSGWLCDADTWCLERTAPQDEPITYKVTDGRVTHWHELPEPPVAAAIREMAQRER